MTARWGELDENGQTAVKSDLLKAIRDKNMDFVEDWLDRGMPANLRFNVGQQTLLYKLAWENALTTPLALKLLNNGAELEERMGLDDTVLHGAAASGAENSLRVLLQLGANPNARDNVGNTPMHLSAEKSGNLQKMLFRAGGDLEARNFAGQAPSPKMDEDDPVRIRRNERFSEVKRWAKKQTKPAEILQDDTAMDAWLGRGSPFTHGDIAQATWEHFPATLKKLREAGQPVREEDLWISVGEEAPPVNILTFAARDLQLNKVLAALHDEGVSIGEKTLLDGNGEPSLACSALVRHQCLNAVFTRENWQTRPRAELSRVLNALPDEYRAFAPNGHRLLAATTRTAQERAI